MVTARSFTSSWNWLLCCRFKIKIIHIKEHNILQLKPLLEQLSVLQNTKTHHGISVMPLASKINIQDSRINDLCHKCKGILDHSSNKAPSGLSGSRRSMRTKALMRPLRYQTTGMCIYHKATNWHVSHTISIIEKINNSAWLENISDNAVLIFINMIYCNEKQQHQCIVSKTK